MTAGTEVAAPSDGRRRRRRWPWVLAIVVVAVLIIAFVVADTAGRAYAKQLVAHKIGSALGAAPSSLDVKFSPTPLLLQLIEGRIESVDVSSPAVTFGQLTGALAVHAVDVPLDQNAPTRALDIRYSVDQPHLQKLASTFAGGAIQSVALKAPDVVATGSVKVLGFGVPLGVSLTPSAVHGQLAFTPSSVTLGGQEYTAAQLSAILGSVATPFLSQQTFCIARYLPKALTVDRVAVIGDVLQVEVSGDGVVLGGPGLSTKGSCGS